MATVVPDAAADVDPLVQLSNLEKNILECFSQLEHKLAEKKTATLARIATLRDSYKRYLNTCNSKKLNETAKINLESLLSLEPEGSSNIIHYRNMINRLATNLKLQSLLLINTLNNFSVLDYRCSVFSAIDELNEWSFDMVVTPVYHIRKEPFLCRGGDGSGQGEFNLPQGLSVDSADNVYVADFWNSRIQVMSIDGKYVREIKNQKMSNPFGLCLINDAIFITDFNKHCLFKFQLDGTLLNQTGSKGQLEGDFNHPEGITVGYNDDNDSSVYVCDRDNNRLQVFTQQDLAYVNTISGDYIVEPRDVNIHNNTLFVLVNNNRLICIAKTGELIRELSEVEYHVAGSYNFCFDNYSNILISDFGKCCFHVFSNAGRYNLSIGDALTYVSGITVASDNRIICVTGLTSELHMF